MLHKVQEIIHREQLFLPGETIVVGLSGGVDSTALVHILQTLNKHYQYGWDLHAVHLNHSFRGEESDEDAVYAKRFCHTLGVECHLFKRDVPAYMATHQLGAQEASRLLRYELFTEVAEQVAASKVVLAHHADDQVETVLFRMIRGTGLAGLSGIPMRRWLVPGQVEIVRPLLFFPKKELQQYCDKQGILPREDSSNASRKYARNRLRLDVLPVLEQINPQYTEHIVRLSEMARVDDQFLTRQSRNELEMVTDVQESHKIVISRKKFQTCDLALQRRMITLILSYLSSGLEWSSQHVEAVLRIIKSENPSAVLHLPHQLVVKRVYEKVHFFTTEQPSNCGSFFYDLDVPCTLRLSEQDVMLHVRWLDTAPDWSSLPKFSAVFDGDRLPGELRLRSRHIGDRIRLAGGSKKLKELFIDAKIPKDKREQFPLIVSGDCIIWVPGVRRSTLALVDDQTELFLYMEAEFGEGWQEVFNE